MTTPITQLRGFNACQVWRRTNSWVRGGFWYPDNLEDPKGDEYEQTYEEWCTALESAGVNLIRLRLDGRNLEDDVGSAGIEPPPYGTFNICHTALDPSNLPQYRADQVTHPVAPATWAASNLGQLCVAAENHGIKFVIIPFYNREWRALNNDWNYHSWNVANKYINGDACEAQDQGFLTNARDLFTDSTAIAAAKARIKFLIDVLAPYDVVACWEICAELTWICTDYDFWAESGWGSEMLAHIRDEICPWVSEMADYIHANDSSGAPVTSGHVRTRSNEQAWDADPDHLMNAINDPHLVSELDGVWANWYVNGNPDRAIAALILLQEKCGNDVFIGQFWPFRHPSVPPGEADEDPPYLVSLLHHWIHVCGIPGLNGPLRWPGFEETNPNVWADGGYADPDLHDISGISETFAGYADWSQWDDSADEDFESYVSASGVTRHVAWGDQQHVVMMVDFSSSGSKTITTSNLVDGPYTVRVFNWVTGVLDSTQRLIAESGSLSFTHNVTFTDNVLVAYLEMQTQEGSVTSAGALVGQAGKVLGGGVAPAGVLVRQAAVAPSGGVTPAGALVRQVEKVLGGTM